MPLYNRNTKPISCDTVSFTSIHSDKAMALKSLLYHKIPDLYSDVILLPPGTINEILDANKFSPRLIDVLKQLKTHRDSLFPVEKEFYNILREAAKKQPGTNLNTFVRSLVPKYHTQLFNTQQDIFERLNLYAPEIPSELLDKYNYLLYTTDEKLHNRQVIIPFSLKEFKYKLSKIGERIGFSGQTEASQTMKELIAVANSIADIPKEQRSNPKFKSKKYEYKQKVMISRFQKILEHSVLKNDRDLLELLRISQQQIYKVPTIIPFNRKSFIYEIQKITSLLEDKHLARMIEKDAVSLPTSKEDICALVVKEAERSSDQIVYDLLHGSIGSIDHLLAAHKGGKSDILNYGLASSYMNSQKAHSSFETFIKHYPNVPKCIQRQINRLIQLANDGVFDEAGLEKFYIISLANRLEKLSSKKHPLNIDTNKLIY